MFELFALVGGFWFFLFVIAIFACGIWSAEYDNMFGGTFTLLALAAGAQFLFGIPVYQTILANPLLLVVGVVAYIGVGLAYAVMYRYADYLRFRADHIKMKWGEFQIEYKKTNDLDDSVPTRDEFRKSYQYREYTPSSNADRIAAWVMMWPWAVFWDLSHKPLRWVYNNMYSLAGKALDRVGAKVSDKILDKKT
jgi:hypothetical protein|tara:strand:+ start:2155 stop:2736 length:582 start_codon:yes stop_codon:yes gene_type:complete